MPRRRVATRRVKIGNAAAFAGTTPRAIRHYHQIGLLTDRLSRLPSGALRPSDLDALLVTERIFGPLGAAIQASAFITLATHPHLRAEADRIDAADAALDDTVDPTTRRSRNSPRSTAPTTMPCFRPSKRPDWT